MAFTKHDHPRNCPTVPHKIDYTMKLLSIVPNGRAETLITDEDGVEYELIEIYRPVNPPPGEPRCF